MTIHPNYEKTLIEIARALPANRMEQLVDFARFLESQSLTEKLLKGEDLTEIEADNAEWDAILASEESQALLEKLADEALAEHRAGKTRPTASASQSQGVPGRQIVQFAGTISKEDLGQMRQAIEDDCA